MKDEGYFFDEYDRPDRIGDTARIFSSRSGGLSNGEIFYSRARLYSEGVAFARYLKRKTKREKPRVLLTDAGVYEVSLLLVSCALLGCELWLVVGNTDSVPECDAVVGRRYREDFSSARFISSGEIPSILLGESLIEPPENERLCGEIEICFLSENGFVKYTEREAILIAREYARAMGLVPFDAVITTLSPLSREGFFGGILAPFLHAKRWVCVDEGSDLFDEMRLLSPTKLFCDGGVFLRFADEVERVSKLPSAWKKGQGSHPVRRKLDKLFPRTRAALRFWRLLSLHSHFGGRLSGACVLGEADKEQSARLLDFGVLTSSVISIPLHAIVGHRRAYDKEGFYRLPRYLSADMTDVIPRGYGCLTFFVGWDDKSAAKSELFGFPTRKGGFFVAQKSTFLQ